MKAKIFAIAIAGALAIGTITGALASVTYSLFGEASIVTGGNPGNAAQLTSDSAQPLPYGGVSLTSTTVTTLGTLTDLGTNYKITTGDCGGGSPRFSIGVDTDGDGTRNGSIFVYIGPSPSFTGCTTASWQLTGNLLTSTDGRVDSTQLGGPYYGTWADALTIAGATSAVTSISLVVDGGWLATQTVFVDNVTVNGDVVTFDLPADKDACKNDGWESLLRSDGTPFKNQGDCIQFVNTGK